MTVEELIKTLETFDPDEEIICNLLLVGEEGYPVIGNIDDHKKQYQRNNSYILSSWFFQFKDIIQKWNQKVELQFDGYGPETSI